MFSTRVRIIAGALIASVCFQTAAVAQSTLERIVAVVDDDVIVESELVASLKEVERDLRRRKLDVPPAASLKVQTLENMINERVLLHEAQRRGITVPESEIDAAVDTVARRNKIDTIRLQELLAREGTPMADYRESIRNRLVVQRLVEGEISRRIKISDDEVEMALQQNLTVDDNDSLIEYELARVLIPAPEGTDQLQQQMLGNRAKSIRARLDAGANIASVARESSLGPEASAGGNLGWRKSNQLPALYIEALSQMKPGDTSQVLRGPNGFHILKLLDVKGGAVTVVDEYRIRQILIRSNNVLSSEELLRRLLALKERILQGEDFAELATSHSEDVTTQAAGGDMGWVSTSSLPRTIAGVVEKLEINGLSEPMQTDVGYHLFQLMDKRQQDAADLVQRDAARRAVYRRKSEELYESWAEQLRASAYVEMRLDDF